MHVHTTYVHIQYSNKPDILDRLTVNFYANNTMEGKSNVTIPMNSHIDTNIHFCLMKKNIRRLQTVVNKHSKSLGNGFQISHMWQNRLNARKMWPNLEKN